MDENKHPNQQPQKENQKVQAEGTNVANRRIFSKRWLYPAIYLGAAALIIGLMYIKSQVGGSSPTVGSVDNTTATPTPAPTAAENFEWPVKSGEDRKVTMGYFPVNGTLDQQAKAVVNYDNGWYPHEGLDIKSTIGKTLDVTAALSGKVTSVTDNQQTLNGNMVEITSDNGYITRYESLGQVGVKVGDTVNQGDLIGTSGTNLFEPGQGNHVYFEVVKDNQKIDPATVLPKN